MNKDIYMLDLLYDDAMQDENDREKYDISDLVDDDDFGDNDGDENY